MTSSAEAISSLVRIKQDMADVHRQSLQLLREEVNRTAADLEPRSLRPTPGVRFEDVLVQMHKLESSLAALPRGGGQSGIAAPLKPLASLASYREFLSHASERIGAGGEGVDALVVDLATAYSGFTAASDEMVAAANERVVRAMQSHQAGTDAWFLRYLTSNLALVVLFSVIWFFVARYVIRRAAVLSEGLRSLYGAVDLVPELAGVEAIARQRHSVFQDIAVAVLHFREAITARMRAQAGLERERSRLHSLMHGSPDLIWMKDGDGVYLVCNPRFESLLGQKEAEIVGKTDYDLFALELADFFRLKDQAAIGEGKACANEEWLTFSDGHRELVETIKTPMLDPDGRLIGVMGVARNITALYEARKALEDSEANLKGAQMVARIGSWSADIAQNKLYWSDEICRMFGIPVEQTYSLDDFIGYLHPSDQERVLAAWVAALKGAPYDVEHRVIIRGVTRWVRERAEFRYGADRRAVFAVGDCAGHYRHEDDHRGAGVARKNLQCDGQPKSPGGSIAGCPHRSFCGIQ